ncbi:MAG: hypothetical protein U5L75_03700 [Candidatus Campbellbacteria bacterium]|nr:hypothetical protein [Candidatus Campbellbacteria bacterium]
MEGKESFPQNPEGESEESSPESGPEAIEGDKTESGEVPEFDPERVDTDKLREAIRRAKNS